MAFYKFKRKAFKEFLKTENLKLFSVCFKLIQNVKLR